METRRHGDMHFVHSWKREGGIVSTSERSERLNERAKRVTTRLNVLTNERSE